ncbi:MAG: 50S ribosomal protein L22 [Acidobacteriota bacterium]|nr:50S ribosomal protein L22 [Acidobacteriota bacterium]
MEFTARLRYLQASPQKVRLVADLIRGLGVQDAANTLQLTNKSAATPIRKLLSSAVANAEDRDENVDVDTLYVKEIFVDQGPMLKRLRPAPQGRALRILKRQSHVTIKLDTRDEASAARSGLDAVDA